MNPYVKKYFKRGLMFAGFGPIIVGIVYLILELAGTKLELTGYQVFLAILSTYLIGFVHAASSTFPEIDKWSKVKAMFFQFISLYSVYSIGYLINGWLPFDWKIFSIFTAAFVGTFLAIWAIVVISVNAVTKNLNKKLNDKLQEK